MGQIKFSNNAATTINGAHNSSVTTINVNDDSEWPTLGEGDWCYATVISSGGLEVLKVTAIAGDTFTVTRAQDDTVALAFVDGDRVELRNNAGAFNDLRDHNHDGSYEPADATILKDADIGVNVLAPNGDGSQLQNLPAAGATGGGDDEVFVENSRIVTTNYTLSEGKNAHSVGPISINTGITVTVPTGARWVIS